MKSFQQYIEKLLFSWKDCYRPGFFIKCQRQWVVNIQQILAFFGSLWMMLPIFILYNRAVQFKEFYFLWNIHIFDSVSVRRNVIFGGDLNMRDKELAEVGGIPAGTKDCWQHCGAREVAKYTWDMTRYVL